MLGRDHASAHVAILAYLELGRTAWLFVVRNLGRRSALASPGVSGAQD